MTSYTLVERNLPSFLPRFQVLLFSLSDNTHMTLQNTFYVIGIICMGLYTILFLSVVIVLFYIWKKITDIQKEIESRLQDLKDIFHDPKQAAADMGASAASSAFNQVAEWIRPKKKDK